ncbi:hypothetical protein JHK85_009547 [Glycine max]|nr:hypothetical protein JHK85_009547 [Glycine max]
MESGELRVASARIGSSSVWRSSGGVDVFSGSSRRDDDEQELKWAAIEKLPTYLRMTRGILTEAEGQPTEIDINKLCPLQRKNLVERLVKIAEQDNEKFLFKLRDRIDSVGLEIPAIEVRFEHLNVEAEAHVGSRALPTIFNFCINLLEGFLNSLHLIPSRKKPFTVLDDVSGIIKPKRMSLLLGPPSSGKTTLLLALAGRLGKDLKVRAYEICFCFNNFTDELESESFKAYDSFNSIADELQFSGRVSYNGHGMEEFVPQRTSAYISQTDLHIGEMTVRETLAFSARCQGIGTRNEMLAELSRREKAANIKPDPDLDIYMKAAALEGQETNVVTDYIMKILGLEICADTMVGDDMIRGISGGQKKRVTTGEMLVGPARALLMDEISTGLDSSTTFQMVNSLRQSIHILNGTAVISLLQPAPETYELFDDIILLSDGQIVYQGPRENVLEFFEYMGFKCPERKGVADFLQEVTSRKDQEQYWANKDEPYSFVTVKEFAEAFQSFHVGRKLGDELATPFDMSKGHPAVLTKNKYGVCKKELLKACVSREFLLMKRNSFVYIFKMWQLILTGFITMTLFLRTEMHRDTETDGGIYMGALFFVLIVIMFNGYSELSMSIMKLPVFYKQRDLLFFPCWAYSLPTWILKIPITLVEVGIWVVMTYYVIGFDPSIERFIKQYFLLVCINQMASGLFRFMGAVGRNIIVANTVGSFALLAVMVMGGFILSRVDVKKWWLWGYWFSPMMYGQNALAVNEFLGKSWSHVPPNSTEPLGVKVLKSRGIFPEAYWYWIGVGASIGYMLLFNFLFPLALHYLDPFGKPQALISEEALAERNAGRNEHIIELSSRIKGSSGYVQGQITISGYPKKQETFARIAGYCEQTDIHSPHVTVYESLVYSAWLRLPPEVDSVTRQMFIEEVMELVELTSLREALVGLPGVNGLSTEQRKRLTIAVELVANPSIIFMDEPTSGLDARAAAIVMRTVRNTVDTGRTVVCTIHQPSIDIFDAFDEHLSYWRNPPYSAVRLLFTTIIALLFGTIFWDIGSKRQRKQDLFNAMGSMYAAVLFIGIQNATSVQPVVAIERTVFYRERAAGMYSALPYAFGQVAIEIPYIFIQTLVYGVIVYAMIGFDWTFSKFFWYLFFMFFTFLYFTFYGMMAVGLTPDHNVATIVSFGFYMIWNLFSGFVIPRTRMPVWWRWYFWICPVSWTLYGLVTSQFGDIKERIDTGETVEEFVRSYFGYRDDFVGVAAAVLVGFTLLFGFTFAFSIKAFNFQKR